MKVRMRIIKMKARMRIVRKWRQSVRQVNGCLSMRSTYVRRIAVRSCILPARVLVPGGGERGPRGLTYDETSLLYSLLWNQPSIQPSQYSYSSRRLDTTLVRRGGQAEVKTATLGLPIFYTDSPDHPLSEDETGEGGGEDGSSGGVTELHELVGGYTTNLNVIAMSIIEHVLRHSSYLAVSECGPSRSAMEREEEGACHI